jgi:signal transduction histidine kinase/ActR/RegA family two-component response regulator/HPt (histidine-containing phosphotransfer) domain-containing protein
MSSSRPKPHAASTAPRIYTWELSKEVVRFEGPLSRPASQRRELEMALSDLPEILQLALHRNRDAGNRSFPVGKRIVQIIATESHTGFLIHYTRLYHWENRLTTYLKWLEEGINALPEAFVLYDADDRLLIANPQYAELYPTVANLLHPGITFPEIAEAALKRGQFRYSESADEWLKKRIQFHDRGEGFFEQHLNDGRWIQLSERRTKSGGVTSIRADITLLKEREKALQKAKYDAERTSESMARFLAMLSHEVSNGLNGLAGLAQILALDVESPSQQTNTNLMLQSTKRLTNVLSDLLDYLKNEAMGVAIKHTATSPQNLLDILRAELEPQAERRSVSLNWVVSEPMPAYVNVDQGRILQILANLTGNALKYAEHGGVLTVRIMVESHWLRFEVQDRGAGIAPEDVKKLFEYFSQTDSTNATGTGIGLAICKQLVTAMAGEIGVDSKLGQGSTFWFTVPLQVVTVKAPEGTEKLFSRTMAALRVGIVDDDPLNLQVAHALLVHSGHHAFILDRGQDIACVIKEQRLDVLLLDLMMPKESGFDIAARLRALPDAIFSRLIFIALTGNVIPNNLIECRKAGIDAVLQKPLFIEQLQYALTWAATFDRSAQNEEPFVFATLGLSTPDSSGKDDTMPVLKQLMRDIGSARFNESMRFARCLIEQALHIKADDPESLRKYAHRVTGTASQMGFLRLSEHARTLENLLTSSSTSGPDRNEADSQLQKLRMAAAESLPILDQAIQDSAGV